MANNQRTSEETVVVATYSSRHDAETAKSFLSDQGITAFVTADDVHPPLQITEGSRVRVMSRDLPAAREALNDAKMLPGSDSEAAAPDADATLEEAGGMPRWKFWLYVGLAVLFILAVIIQAII